MSCSFTAGSASLLWIPIADPDRLPRSMEKLLNWSFIGKEHMTGLPEYRNGKLMGHRYLKPQALRSASEC